MSIFSCPSWLMVWAYFGNGIKSQVYFGGKFLKSKQRIGFQKSSWKHISWKNYTWIHKVFEVSPFMTSLTLYTGICTLTYSSHTEPHSPTHSDSTVHVHSHLPIPHAHAAHRTHCCGLGWNLISTMIQWGAGSFPWSKTWTLGTQLELDDFTRVESMTESK